MSTASRIDYRTQRWGHAIHQLRRTGGTHTSGAPMFRCSVHSGVRPSPGTELIVNMASGKPAVFIIDAIEYVSNVDDMYNLDLHPDHYLDDENSALSSSPGTEEK